MHLLDLGDGSVSLEFSEAEQDKVLAQLRTLGPIRRTDRGAFYDVLDLGGESFLHYFEWDPCLIASSPAAAQMLRSVADRGDGALAA